MRLAIFSDVHGDIRNLEKFLRKVEQEKVDKVVCLGDLVRKYKFDNEPCVKVIRESGIQSVRGNHDDKALRKPAKFHLSEENLAFLQSMPYVLKFGPYFFVHKLVYPLDLNEPGLKGKFSQMNGSRIGFFGHIHYPIFASYGMNGDVMLEKANNFQLQPDAKYLIDPGPIEDDGLFAILDEENGTFVRRSVA